MDPLRGLVPLPGFEREYQPTPPPQLPYSVAPPYWANGAVYLPPGYKEYKAKAMPGATYNFPVVQNLDLKVEEDHDIIQANKERAKPRRKNMPIEGETVADLVNNIIKNDANLKQTRDAFRKIVGILEDARELDMFAEF